MTRHLWVFPTAAAVTALALSGCTGDKPDTDPSSSKPSTSSASGTPSSRSPALKDRSAEVVDGAAPLTPIATSKAKATSTFKGSTFTFYRLTRTDTSTELVWQVTGGPQSNSNDAVDDAWERYPVLRTKDADYWVVTFQQTPIDWVSVSNPALRLSNGVKAPLQSALYPPLPAGTTSITLRSPWFEDVTVPVSAAS
jgi:hypothetical protein